MPTISKGLKQAYDLQDLTYQAAISIGERVSPGQKISREDANVLANLVRAWESCQERIRIHRNKPLPGSRRPVPEQIKPSKSERPKNLPPDSPPV
jgi:hypothetical protein